MNIAERQCHLKKVQSTLPGKVNEVFSDVGMPVEEAIELLNIPAPCLEGIWQKAGMILSSSSNVASAPGQPMSARMVVSSSGKRPHLVSPCKGQVFKCDNDCLNFKSMSICSHTVAVASCQNKLPQFVNALGKAKKALMSLTSTSWNALRFWKKGGATTRKQKHKETITDRVPWNLSPTVIVNVTGSSNSLAEVQATNVVSTIQQPSCSPFPLTEQRRLTVGCIHIGHHHHPRFLMVFNLLFHLPSHKQKTNPFICISFLEIFLFVKAVATSLRNHQHLLMIYACSTRNGVPSL